MSTSPSPACDVGQPSGRRATARARGTGPDFLPPVPPQRPEVVTRLLRGCQGAGALLALLDAAGGYLVQDGPDPGTCTVVLARLETDPRERTVAVIDTVTHMHREDLSPFVLERRSLHGVALHASAFVLPRGLRASTALLVERDLDLHLGRDRGAWVRALRRTEPLSTSHEVLTAGGARSSVIRLPGALPQPFTEPGTEPAPGPPPGPLPGPGAVPAGSTSTRAARRRAPTSVPAAGRSPATALRGTTRRDRISSSVLGLDLDVWCYLPAPRSSPAQALLIACDGDVLTSKAPILPSLDRLNASGASLPVAAVLFSPAEARRRPEVLGMVPGLAQCLETEVLAWARALADLPQDPSRLAVSGASLGGLAAADLVRRRPGLVANAVVQSGAFWWPADEQGRPTEAQLRLWREQRGPALPDSHDSASPASPPVRIFQEVGTLEGHLLGCNRRFRDVLQERRVDITYREYVGGHDFACWRGGIIDGLVHLFPARAG